MSLIFNEIEKKILELDHAYLQLKYSKFNNEVATDDELEKTWELFAENARNLMIITHGLVSLNLEYKKEN